MVSILYLAKPTYGGWVSFTSFLSKINNKIIYKITNRGEKKEREFGYNTKYRNINIETLKNINEHIIITAIDKHFHHILPNLENKKCSIVIHDPTEIKSNKYFIKKYLENMDVITIRQNVSDFLYSLNIPNNFIKHPYICHNNEKNNGNINTSGAISISRIDWDKHIDIILKANLRLTNKIDIYGKKNDIYVYQKLRELDSLDEKDPSSCYKGIFPKKYSNLKTMLKSKKFVIDLSDIKNDGGGTQYTYLEAIDNNCILILNKNWVDTKNSIWKDKQNCLVVSNENDLIELLHYYSENKSESERIIDNSKEILKQHNSKELLDKWIFN